MNLIIHLLYQYQYTKQLHICNRVKRHEWQHNVKADSDTINWHWCNESRICTFNAMLEWLKENHIKIDMKQTHSRVYRKVSCIITNHHPVHFLLNYRVVYLECLDYYCNPLNHAYNYSGFWLYRCDSCWKMQAVER